MDRVFSKSFWVRVPGGLDCPRLSRGFDSLSYQTRRNKMDENKLYEYYKEVREISKSFDGIATCGRYHLNAVVHAAFNIILTGLLEFEDDDEFGVVAGYIPHIIKDTCEKIKSLQTIIDDQRNRK